MAANCSSHITIKATIFCETCKTKICRRCSDHEPHTQIPLNDIDTAIANFCSEHQFINNHIRTLEKTTRARVDYVIKTVEDAGEEMLEQLKDVRQYDAETTKLLEEIKNRNDPIEEKYLKAKELKKSRSKYPQSKRLEFIQSLYDSGIIPKVLGRLEWVDENQELVEIGSFKSSESSFIKSIWPVDSSKAWILYYRDKGIYLIDYNGQVLEKRNLGERIEDFCLTACGDVLFTPWNGRELKKHYKDNEVVSLFTFEESYTTRGICFRGEDVMVCLCSSNSQKPNMLAKMSIADTTANILMCSAKNGFMEPGRVKCSIGGSIAVVDWSDTGRFLKVVDGDGESRWTWTGEMNTGSKLSPFQPYDVLFCNINEEKRLLVTLHGSEWNKVYSLDVDGKDGKCIYTGEINSCCGALAVDPDGHIWIGDGKGRVHIMKAIKSKG